MKHYLSAIAAAVYLLLLALPVATNLSQWYLPTKRHGRDVLSVLYHQQVPAEPLWLEVVVVVLPRVVVPSPRHDPAVLPRAPPRLVLPGADVDPRRGTTEVLLVIVLVVGAARARDPGAFPTPSSTRPFLVVVSSYRSLRTLPPLATRRAPAQHQANEDPEGGARRASRPALDVPQRALDLAPPVHRARRDGPVEHLPGAAVSSPVRPLLF